MSGRRLGYDGAIPTFTRGARLPRRLLCVTCLAPALVPFPFFFFLDFAFIVVRCCFGACINICSCLRRTTPRLGSTLPTMDDLGSDSVRDAARLPIRCDRHATRRGSRIVSG